VHRARIIRLAHDPNIVVVDAHATHDLTIGRTELLDLLALKCHHSEAVPNAHVEPTVADRDAARSDDTTSDVNTRYTDATLMRTI
jgi:hypothetical protein